MASEELKRRFPVGSIVLPATVMPTVLRGNGLPGSCPTMDRIWGTGTKLKIRGYHHGEEWLEVEISIGSGSYFYPISWVRSAIAKPITLYPDTSPIPTLRLNKKRQAPKVNLAPKNTAENKSEVSLPAVFGSIAMAIFGVAGAKAGLKKLQESKAKQIQKHEVKGTK